MLSHIGSKRAGAGASCRRQQATWDVVEQRPAWAIVALELVAKLAVQRCLTGGRRIVP